MNAHGRPSWWRLAALAALPMMQLTGLICGFKGGLKARLLLKSVGQIPIAH
jgi:hypothetical protein